MFEIEFYETKNGKIPVEEFLNELPTKLRAKAVRELEILEKKGNLLREPYSKYIRDGIFELRVKFSSDIARVFYSFYIDEKTPSKEIEKALNYKKNYEGGR